MPVRSLNSSVLTWPDAKTVHQAVCRWAAEIARAHPHVLRIGYFGSYARGDWGVGSDLDLLLIVRHAELSPERRAAAWDVTDLPVPADLLVYTAEEWEALDPHRKFARVLKQEVVWVYVRSDSP